MNPPAEFTFITDLLGATIRIEEDRQSYERKMLGASSAWVQVARGVIRSISLNQYGPTFWIANAAGIIEIVHLDTGGQQRRIVLEKEPEK